MKFDPSNIRCGSHAQARRGIVNSCQNILNTVSVDEQRRTFSLNADASVRLPWFKFAGM